jgi:hypothetical protein
METRQDSIYSHSTNSSQCDCPRGQDYDNQEVSKIIPAVVVGLVLGGLYVLLSERSRKTQDTNESNPIENNAIYEARQNIINNFRA